MSSFKCIYCGAEIIDTEHGYITGCRHYPREDNPRPDSKKDKDDEAIRKLKEMFGWN